MKRKDVKNGPDYSKKFAPEITGIMNVQGTGTITALFWQKFPYQPEGTNEFQTSLNGCGSL